MRLQLRIKAPGQKTVVMPLPHGVSVEVVEVLEEQPYRGYVSDAELAMLRKLKKFGAIIFSSHIYIQTANKLSKKGLVTCDVTSSGAYYTISERGCDLLTRRGG